MLKCSTSQGRCELIPDNNEKQTTNRAGLTIGQTGVMGQHDHNMADDEESTNSDESTITYQTVRFTELMQDPDMAEVD